MSGYRIERLSQDTLKHLLNLYKQTFGVQASLEHFQKKYATNAFGASLVGFLAFDKISGEPAAYYGVFPIKCILNGRVVLAAQSGDTMTHPKHQGKGLFISLAKATYDLSKQLSIAFVFGFPNSKSYGGFVKKLGWSHYSNVNNYSISVRTLPFAKIVKKFEFLQPLYRRYINARLKPFIERSNLSNSLSKQCPGKGFVLHDENFYRYKTYYTSYQVKIGGTSVVLKVDGRIWVGDIEFCSKEQLMVVLKKIKSIARVLGCTSIQLSLFEGSFYDTIIGSKYEVKSKNAVGCLAFNEAIDPTAFAYQGIDFDTF